MPGVRTLEAPQTRGGTDQKSRVLIGTSGWSYEHWDGIFYPNDLPASKRLQFYASRFDTVEVNATFYRLPTVNAVRHWRDQVPEDFTFSVKGSRYITHVLRMVNADKAAEKFVHRVRALDDRLDVVLWQFPPNLKPDISVLEAFLSDLPDGPLRHAIEFRDEQWLTEKVFSRLRKHGVAHVNVSSDKMPADFTTTADFAYVRFHGTAQFGGAYPREALKRWSAFIAEQSGEGRDCYVYFNNDFDGHAVFDAELLGEMLEERV